MSQMFSELLKNGDRIINGPYSLFVCASYFISCSIHARFASVTFIDCKWHWGCRHFLNFSYFYVLYRSYQVNNKVIDVLYILMYYYTGILFVVLREGWVSYTRLQETCRDAHERSGTNKLIWECCISYSTSIGVVFGYLKTTGG